jgi:hypothetical protein
MKFSLPAVVVVAFLMVCACGGSKSRRAASLEAAKAGDIVTLDGNLSLRGSTPFPMLMLQTDGGFVLVESSDLGAELKSLTGMAIRIEAVVLPSLDNETRAVNARSYELLPLPTGETPVVGTVTVENDQCVLTTFDNRRYWIRGDFADVFRDFAGERVWVAGTVGEYALPEQPEETVPYKVQQYGVLTAR